MDKLLQKRRLVIYILFTTILLLPSISFAAEGNLNIHNNVIYDKENNEIERNYVERNIPDLFLQDKVKVNDEINEQNKQKLLKVRNHNFVNYKEEDSSVLEGIDKKLFSKDYEFIDYQQKIESKSKRKLPKWSKWFVISLLGIFLIFSGIRLGEKFSYVFVRKK